MSLAMSESTTCQEMLRPWHDSNSKSNEFTPARVVHFYSKHKKNCLHSGNQASSKPYEQQIVSSTSSTVQYNYLFTPFNKTPNSIDKKKHNGNTVARFKVYVRLYKLL